VGALRGVEGIEGGKGECVPQPRMATRIGASGADGMVGVDGMVGGGRWWWERVKASGIISSDCFFYNLCTLLVRSATREVRSKANA